MAGVRILLIVSVFRVRDKYKVRELSIYHKQATKFVGIFISAFEIFNLVFSDQLTLYEFIEKGCIIIPVEGELVFWDQQLSYRDRIVGDWKYGHIESSLPDLVGRFSQSVGHLDKVGRDRAQVFAAKLRVVHVFLRFKTLNITTGLQIIICKFL